MPALTPSGEGNPAEIRILGFAHNYDELHTLVRARFAALGFTCNSFDDICGWASGLAGKIFGPSQIKRLGPDNLPIALGALGLRLAVTEDPDALARIKDRIPPRKVRRLRARGRGRALGAEALARARPQVLQEYFSRAARRLNESRTPAERSIAARKAANARWHGAGA